MFGKSAKGGAKKNGGGKGKARTRDNGSGVNNGNGAQMAVPEPVIVAEEEPLPTLDETEMILLNLHSSLIDFYTKHKPQNVDEDVLTILMQFFIDAGGVALNKKLMNAYGEDLNTFKRIDDNEPPPPPVEVEYNSKTLQRMKRQSLEKNLDISLPPPPTFETNVVEVRENAKRASIDSHISIPPVHTYDKGKRNKKSRAINDPELKKFKDGKNKERVDLERDVDELFGSKPPPEEDPALKLYILDKPDTDPLEPRDLIEAFYAKHDETKLDRENGIEKFILWVDQHSLQELSDKLKGKYKEGLLDVSKLARRRKNLENKLKSFYLKYDKPKLDTRWTILKILSWTMIHGVEALNKKFLTRYGHNVIEVKETAKDAAADDLDI